MNRTMSDNPTEIPEENSGSAVKQRSASADLPKQIYQQAWAGPNTNANIVFRLAPLFTGHIFLRGGGGDQGGIWAVSVDGNVDASGGFNLCVAQNNLGGCSFVTYNYNGTNFAGFNNLNNTYGYVTIVAIGVVVGV
jgi:hypothetical protein